MALQSTHKPDLADSRLIACLIGGLGMILIVAPVVTGGKLPGDLLDGRFNNYVLEHVYLWVTLQVPDFWNAPFFYPYQMTIAFSDSHIGDSPVYVLARMAGISREGAFGLWYAAGYALNFIAADYTLVRLGLLPSRSGARRIPVHVRSADDGADDSCPTGLQVRGAACGPRPDAGAGSPVAPSP